jgi:hypothetical protein
MPISEFYSWIEYYKLFPFDDRALYFKPSVLTYNGLGGDAEKAMEYLDSSLRTEIPDDTSEFSEVDMSIIRSLKGQV